MLPYQKHHTHADGSSAIIATLISVSACRDPHHSLQGTHQDSNSRFHAIANRAHTPFASNSADPAPLAPAATPRDAVSRQFPPAGVNPEQQMHSIPPAVQALAALLSNSKLSASDVTHLQSLANSEETGNLGQLAAQLEMAIQLAQSSGQPQMHTQPHTQAVTLPEPTHRVQIPAAQLMDRSAARVASANLVSSGAATVASGASGVAPGAPAQGVQETAEPASRQQPARTDKAAAQKLSRQEPASALDLVAEVAAAEETTEPSELLMYVCAPVLRCAVLPVCDTVMSSAMLNCLVLCAFCVVAVHA